MKVFALLFIFALAGCNKGGDSSEGPLSGNPLKDPPKKNGAPLFDAIPDQSIDEGQILNYQLKASDPDSDNLKYTCTQNCPTNFTVSEEGNVKFAPDYAQSGAYDNIQISVTDGVDSASQLMKVTVGNVNQVPVFSPIPDQAVLEGDKLTYLLLAFDLDNDSLSFSCLNCPLNASVTLDGIMTFTPDFTQSGTYDINFSVTDGTAVANQTMKVVVNGLNRVPVFAAIPDQSLKEGESLKYQLIASDADGDALSFSCASGCLANLNVSSDGVITFNPDYTQSGIYNVTFTVTDGTDSVNQVMKVTIVNVNRSPNFASIPDQTVDEAQTLKYQLTATDPDGDSLNFTCVSSCPKNLTISSSGLVNFNPDYTQSGTYNVNFSVSDGSVSVNQTMKITVVNVNQPPVFVSIPDQTVSEGQTLKYQLVASDGDTDKLTFSCITSCPKNLTTTSAGLVTFSPDFTQSGTYNIGFSVSDGVATANQTMKVTVSNVNQSPVFTVIPDQSVNEGQILKYQLIATDPDADTLVFSCLTNCPKSFSVTSTGAVTFSPDFTQSGIYNVTLAVSDGSASANQNMKITVVNTNQPPVFVSIPDQTISEGQVLKYQLVASDADNDKLTFSCITACPKNLSVSASGAIVFSPDYTQSGIYNVVFSVSDGTTSVSQTMKLSVTNVNQAPVFATISDQTVNEGQTLSYQLVATDADSDPLTFTCVSNCPKNLTVSSGGSLVFKPDFTQSGVYNLTLAVTDGTVSINQGMKITVVNVNRAPVFTAIPDQTVNEGKTLTYQLVASDADSDPLTFSCISSCPKNLTVTGVGLVTFNPDFSQSGTYNVNLSVSDGSASVNQAMKITVANVNQAPVFASIPDQSVNEGKTLTYQLVATDSDNDKLTFTCISPCLKNLSVTSAGLVTFNPDYTQSGVYSVGFTVSDGSASVNQTMKITVVNQNQAPVMVAIPNLTATETLSLSYQISASDPEGDALTYSCKSNCPTGFQVTSSGKISWTPTNTQAGTYLNITVAVSDPSNASDQKTFSITVNNNPSFQGWVGMLSTGKPTTTWTFGGTPKASELDGGFKAPQGIALDTTYFYVADNVDHRIMRYDFKGTYQGWIGKAHTTGFKTGDTPSAGTKIGEFNGPSDVALDNSRNLYVVDQLNFRVEKFSSAGSILNQYGSFDINAQNFLDFPTSVAVDSKGNMYVADYYHLNKYDSNGTFIGWVGGLLDTQPPTSWQTTGKSQMGIYEGMYYDPRGVYENSKGEVFVVDTGNHRVHKLNANGSTVGWIGKGTAKWSTGSAPTSGSANGSFRNPLSVASDTQNNIYVTDDGNYRVQKFDANGAFVAKFGSNGLSNGQFFGVSAIVISSKDDIYVGDKNRVQKFDSKLKFQGWIGLRKSNSQVTNGWTSGDQPTAGSASGAFSGVINGMAIDEKTDELFVLDSANNRVQIFKLSDGKFSSSFAIPANSYGFAYDSVRRYKGVSVGSSIYCYDQNNRNYATFGLSGEDPGQFGVVKSLYYTNNELLVVDGISSISNSVKNHRIQKFDGNGNYLGWQGALRTTKTTSTWTNTGFPSLGSNSGSFKNIKDVQLDEPNDKIYIADYDNSRVQVFGLSGGNYLGSFTTVNKPTGIALDSLGVIYVANGSQFSTYLGGVYSLLYNYGSAGSTDGKFNNAFGIAISGYNTFVTDLNNFRVQSW